MPQRTSLGGGGAEKRSSDKAFVIYLYKTERWTYLLMREQDPAPPYGTQNSSYSTVQTQNATEKANWIHKVLTAFLKSV